MFGDLAKANKYIELSNKQIELLESALAASEDMSGLLQRAHEADNIKLREFAQKLDEMASSGETLDQTMKVITNRAIANLRALENFVISKGLWDEFRAATEMQQ